MSINHLPKVLVDSAVFRSTAVTILPEIGTSANTWWEDNPVSLVVPARHYFWWVRTRGTWVWGAGGEFGPAGNGDADKHHVVPKPGQGGGLTGLAQVDNALSHYCVYEPDLDQGVGGKYALVNSNPYELRFKFFCNDHNSKDKYKDNRGAIFHTPAIAPM